jgi:hypothetical protein
MAFVFQRLRHHVKQALGAETAQQQSAPASQFARTQQCCCCLLQTISEVRLSMKLPFNSGDAINGTSATHRNTMRSLCE